MPWDDFTEFRVNKIMHLTSTGFLVYGLPRPLFLNSPISSSFCINWNPGRCCFWNCLTTLVMCKNWAFRSDALTLHGSCGWIASCNWSLQQRVNRFDSLCVPCFEVLQRVLSYSCMLQHRGDSGSLKQSVLQKFKVCKWVSSRTSLAVRHQVWVCRGLMSSVVLCVLLQFSHSSKSWCVTGQLLSHLTHSTDLMRESIAAQTRRVLCWVWQNDWYLVWMLKHFNLLHTITHWFYVWA